jgi:hypothetical protein
MPDFIPCRTGDTEDIHLYPDQDDTATMAADPDRTLCGRPAGAPSPHAGDRPVCPACARRLIAGLIEKAGSAGIARLRITVLPPT